MRNLEIFHLDFFGENRKIIFIIRSKKSLASLLEYKYKKFKNYFFNQKALNSICFLIK